MRFLVILLLCSAMLAAADTPLSVLVGTDLPARLVARREAMLVPTRARYVAGYAAHGSHGAWDATASEAMTSFADLWTSGGKGEQHLMALVKKAVGQGCDDPLIAYIQLRGKGPKATAQELTGVLDRLEKAGYDPTILFSCGRRVIDAHIQAKEAATPACEAMWARLPAFAAPLFKQEPDPAAVRDAIDSVSVLWDLPGSDLALLERQRAMIVSACDLAQGPAWWRLHLLGRWHITAAWACRGSGWANSVTPEGWKGFESHLKQARQSLIAAWQADPRNGWSAAELITVAMGASTRDERVWFERAVAGDPFLEKPYVALRQALLPRWGGSISALLDLAQECVATKAFGTPIARMAVHAVRSALGDAEGKKEEVWGDPRTWAALDAFTTGELAAPGAATEALQDERLAYAWACGQRDETIRLWRLRGANGAKRWLGWLTFGKDDIARFAEECEDWSAPAKKQDATEF